MNETKKIMEKAELYLIRGDDEPLLLTFTDEQLSNAPVDIRNYTVWLTLKKDPKAPDIEALLQVVVTDHPRGEEGLAFIPVTENDWDTGFMGNPIPSGWCRFDVQYKDGEGKPKTILVGDCYVEQDVTHDTEVNP